MACGWTISQRKGSAVFETVRQQVTDTLPALGTYARAIYDLLRANAGNEVTINCSGRMGRRTHPAISLLRRRYHMDIWNNSPGTFVLAGRRVDGRYEDFVLTIPPRCV